MGCFNLNSCKQEVLEKLKADGIETVRAVFVDQHGILRGKTIVSSALETAFDDGINVPSTLLLKIRLIVLYSRFGLIIQTFETFRFMVRAI